MGMLRVLVGGQWVDIGVGADQPATPSDNLFDNGAFQITQQGPGPFTGLTVAQPGRIIDRWNFFLATAGTWTMNTSDLSAGLPANQGPFAAGGARALGFTCTTAKVTLAGTDEVSMSHNIEGIRVPHLAWGSPNAKPLTVSFWVYGPAGTYWLNVYHVGAATRMYTASYTVAATNTFQYVSLVIPGDTGQKIVMDNALRLQFIWFMAAGPGLQGGSATGGWVTANSTQRATGQVNVAGGANSIWWANMMCNVGTTALPFAARSYPDELKACQRYYPRWVDPPLRGVFNTGTQSARSGMQIPLMRAAPSASIFGTLWAYDGSTSISFGAGSISGSYMTPDKIELDLNGAGGPSAVGRPAIFYSSAGGLLSLTAEF